MSRTPPLDLGDHSAETLGQISGRKTITTAARQANAPAMRSRPRSRRPHGTRPAATWRGGGSGTRDTCAGGIGVDRALPSGTGTGQHPRGQMRTQPASRRRATTVVSRTQPAARRGHFSRRVEPVDTMTRWREPSTSTMSTLCAGCVAVQGGEEPVDMVRRCCSWRRDEQGKRREDPDEDEPRPPSASTSTNGWTSGRSSSATITRTDGSSTGTRNRTLPSPRRPVRSALLVFNRGASPRSSSTPLIPSQRYSMSKTLSPSTTSGKEDPVGIRLLERLLVGEPRLREAIEIDRIVGLTLGTKRAVAWFCK